MLSILLQLHLIVPGVVRTAERALKQQLGMSVIVWENTLETDVKVNLNNQIFYLKNSV